MFACMVGPVAADTWGTPEPITTFAADGSARADIAVSPEWTTPVRGGTASAHVQQRGSDGWTTVWRGPLRNDIAPLAALVAPGGQALVTFDDHLSMGRGDNVVVIYDSCGGVAQAWTLVDLLGEDYATALHSSVSSTWWRGEPRLSEDGLRAVVPVIVPSSVPTLTMKDQASVELSIDMATGEVSPRFIWSWRVAQAIATRLATKKRDERAARVAWLRAPLSPPARGDLVAWKAYGRQAVFRLSESEDLPEVVVLDGGSPEAGVLTIRERIPRTGSTLAVVSSDPALLRAALQAWADVLTPRALWDLEIYVNLDAETVASLQRRFDPAGARVVSLPPVIPQRPERLRNLENEP